MSIEQQEARAEINRHNPPTDREVKNVYSATIMRLQDRLIERTEQRDELLTTCRELIDTAWLCGRERQPVIERAQNTLNVIREEKGDE